MLPQWAPECVPDNLQLCRFKKYMMKGKICPRWSLCEESKPARVEKHEPNQGKHEEDQPESKTIEQLNSVIESSLGKLNYIFT